MSSSALVPIYRSEWPELRDLFREGWPENEIPYNVVQNYLDWTSRDPKIRHLQILSLNGNWRENGTFIVKDRHELFFFTLDQTNETLEQALELIDWDFSYRILAILDRHQLVMERVLNKLNKSLSGSLVTTNHQFRLLKEDVICVEVEPPQGFRLGGLEIQHAHCVNTSWPYRHGGSEYMITRFIAWNASVGLFNESNELVAWCLLNNLGFICMLHTDQRYRRKGFGELVLKAMVLNLAKRGLNVTASVRTENLASASLFEKVGFKQEHEVYYLHYKVDRLMEWNF